MKIEQINEAAQSPEVLLEASVRGSFFTTWALTTGLAGTLVVGMSLMTLGSGGAIPVITGIIGLLQSSLMGIWTGAIVSLFARGRQRDLYKKLTRRTKALLKYIKEKDADLEDADTEQEAEEIKAEGKKYIERELRKIEEIQEDLEALIKDAAGDAGPLRTSFRKKLNRKLSGGSDLKDAIKQIRQEVEEFDVAVSQNTGQINTQ